MRWWQLLPSFSHPVASEATGGIVVQLPVVSSQHCWNRIAVFGSETLTAVGVPSIPKRRYC